MKLRTLRVDLRIVLLYTVFGGLWILLSDWLLTALVLDLSMSRVLQTYKDWAFVAASALVIFVLLKREMNASRNRLTDVLASISDGFVAFDREMNYTYINRRGGELLGRKPEDLIGKNYWKEYPEARGTPFADAYLRALEVQTAIHFENHYAPWDRWFENHIYPTREGLSIFFHDITDRKKAELRLDEAQDRLSRIVETIPDGIVILDSRGQIDFANPSAEAILGLSRTGIAERLYNDSTWKITALDGGSFPDDQLPFARVLRTGQPVQGVEHAIEREDGARVLLSINAAPLRAASGELTGVVTSLSDITDRKEAEDLIRSERNFSETVLNSLPGVFYMYDENRQFLRWNKNFETVTGYSGEEIARMNPLDFFAGREKDLLAERIQEVFRAGESQVEADFVSKDGTRTPYYFTGRTILAGGKTCLIGVGIDVAERKRAGEKLRRNEEVLRLLVEHSPAAIAMLDRDMKYIVASRRYLADYDLGEQNLTGRLHYDVFPEIPERWIEIHRRCLAGAVEKADEDPFPRANGRLDWVRWEIRPWHETSGETGGLILFSEVITERKLAEQALRESEALFSKIFASSPIGINIFRVADGRALIVNDAFLKLIGYSRWEAEGHSAAELDLFVDAGPRIQWMNKLRAGEDVYNQDARIRNKSGEIKDTLASLNMVEINGEPMILTIVTDITERKRAEADLRLSNERLAELSRRLVEAHETEQRAIGRELHDQIGQMLTALKLTLEILPQFPAELGAQKLAGAQELVDDLMKRVSLLSLELRPPMLDDLGLIPALLWHVNRYQEQTGIRVDFKHGGVEGRRFPPEIETTAYRLVQEALTNVARHARATQVTLEVRAGDGQMEIRIEDNGQGFDVAAALARNRGLSGMRERVTLLHGTFQVESQPGQGARKLIHLPLREKNP